MTTINVNTTAHTHRIQPVFEDTSSVSRGVSTSSVTPDVVDNKYDFNLDSYLTGGAVTSSYRHTRKIDFNDLLTMVLNIERTTAMEMKKLNSLMQINAAYESADALRESAKQMLIGAIASLALSGAGAALSIGQSYSSLKQSSLAGSKSKSIQGAKNEMKSAATQEARQGFKDQIGSMKREQKEALSKSASMSALASAYQSVSGNLARFSESTAGSFGKHAEADSQKLSGDATVYKDQKDEASKIIDSVFKLVDALNATAKEIRDTQDQVRANIARNV